jgi:thioredoxin 1
MKGTKVKQINESDFESEVLNSAVPVLVDFYADWCGPCKMVAPTMEKLSEEYGSKVKFVKINVDENQELSSKYDIMSIPTAMLFKNGSVEDSIIGAYPATAYRQRLDRAIGAPKTQS